jgi:hypothetical protein
MIPDWNERRFSLVMHCFLSQMPSSQRRNQVLTLKRLPGKHDSVSMLKVVGWTPSHWRRSIVTLFFVADVKLAAQESEINSQMIARETSMVTLFLVADANFTTQKIDWWHLMDHNARYIQPIEKMG